jgi:hypothetical protein
MLEKSGKLGFGYVEGGKTNERKIIKEKEFLEFKSTGFLVTTDGPRPPYGWSVLAR